MKLVVKYYICSGPKVCGKCEKQIPGFLSEKYGETPVDTLSNDVLDSALRCCPTGALQIE